MKRRTLAVITALGATTATTLMLRCGRDAVVDRPANYDTAGAETPPAPVAQPSAAIAAQPAPAAASTAAPTTPLPAARDAATPAAPPPDNAIARALHATDVHDRELLADVERQTRAEPPAALRELLAMRRRGASRAELDHFITERLHDDLRVRIAAQRWARAVAPLPSDPPPSSPDTSFGQGGGVQRIKPLVPKSH